MPSGAAAPFGFFRISAQARGRAGDDVLRDRCRAQLGRLFGSKAAAPVADVIQDWAFDPLTCKWRQRLNPVFRSTAPQTRLPKAGCIYAIQGSGWRPCDDSLNRSLGDPVLGSKGVLSIAASMIKMIDLALCLLRNLLPALI